MENLRNQKFLEKGVLRHYQEFYEQQFYVIFFITFYEYNLLIQLPYPRPITEIVPPADCTIKLLRS